MSHVHRQQVARAQAYQQQRQQPQPAPAQPASSGWLGSIGAGLGAVGSGLYSAGAAGLGALGLGGGETSVQATKEVSKSEAPVAASRQRGDARVFDEDEAPATDWRKYAPNVSAKYEAKGGDPGVRLGGDERAGLGAENYLDALSSRSSLSAKGEIGAGGLSAEVEAMRRVSMLEGAAKGEASGRAGMVGGEVSGSMLSAGVSAKGGVQLDRSGVKASGEVGAGAYAGKAGGKLEGGFNVPFTNIQLYGGAEGEVSAGVGASASGRAEYGAEGARLGGKVSGSVGVGGGLGLYGGFRKADASKGWW